MKMECCGKPVRTPFCPYCGNSIDSSFSLYVHIKNELEKAKNRTMWLKERIDKNDYKHPWKLETEKKEYITSKLKEDRLNGWLLWIKEKLDQENPKK